MKTDVAGEGDLYRPCCYKLLCILISPRSGLEFRAIHQGGKRACDLFISISMHASTRVHRCYSPTSRSTNRGKYLSSKRQNPVMVTAVFQRHILPCLVQRHASEIIEGTKSRYVVCLQTLSYYLL
jgi:hypothetical protein